MIEYILPYTIKYQSLSFTQLSQQIYEKSIIITHNLYN
jgi:hypothetical protein